MKANRGSGTVPERYLRYTLASLGIRNYRLNHAGIVGRPDICFVRKRLVVFIHGCFWHRCLRCAKPLPKHNREFWKAKFRRNRARDARQLKELKALGWKTLVIWEHEIKKDPERAARRVLLGLKSREKQFAKRASRAHVRSPR